MTTDKSAQISADNRLYERKIENREWPIGSKILVSGS